IRRMALSGPPWMLGWACRSPSMPSGVIQPSTMARLGNPPGEMLTCTIEPCMRRTGLLACLGGTGQEACPTYLDVVIQRELVGMRAQADRLRFVLAFVIDEGFDQLLGEDVAAQEEAVVVFQAAQGLDRKSTRLNSSHLGIS